MRSPSGGSSCELAAEILNSGEEVCDPRRPRRARARGDSLLRLPSGSARRSARRFLAKARFPTTAHYATGGIGLLGTRAVAGSAGGVRHAADRRQLFPLYRVLSRARQSACVQIDIDPKRIGLRYPVECRAGRRLRPPCSTRSCRSCSASKTASFLEKAQNRMKEWSELMEERGTRQESR